MKRRILCLLLGAFLLCCLAPDTRAEELPALKVTSSMELMYAEGFSVDYCEGGYKLITIAGKERFLLVPEGAPIPDGLPEGTGVLRQPVENLYLAATSAMCLFDALDAMDSIRLSGTKAEGWYVENARKFMEEGKILFAGKYSEPDYELLLSEHCSLAIESTMIGHASDVADKLWELGIPVLIERSGYEPHPLGRTEWIRLYGALLNREDQAERLFRQQVAYLKEIEDVEATGKTVAFFTITSSGKVVARKSGDYISKMIGLAGGEYVFKDLGDPQSNTSTQTLEMEAFFAGAKDADYIIYNGTLGSRVESMKDLLALSPLLAEFKAVQEGNVWCTEQNMFQESMNLGQMIRSFHAIVTAEAADMDHLPYLTRLR